MQQKSNMRNLLYCLGKISLVKNSVIFPLLVNDDIISKRVVHSYLKVKTSAFPFKMGTTYEYINIISLYETTKTVNILFR